MKTFKWIVARVAFVNMTIFLMITAPLCIVEADGAHHDYTFQPRAEFILILLAIVTAWFIVYMLNFRVRYPGKRKGK